VYAPTHFFALATSMFLHGRGEHIFTILLLVSPTRDCDITQQAPGVTSGLSCTCPSLLQRLRRWGYWNSMHAGKLVF